MKKMSFSKPINLTVYPDGRMDSRNSATYLGVSEGTLALWRSRGIGPKFIKRSRIWYLIEDLDAWLAEARCQSTTQARAISSHSCIDNNKEEMDDI